MQEVVTTHGILRHLFNIAYRIFLRSASNSNAIARMSKWCLLVVFTEKISARPLQRTQYLFATQTQLKFCEVVSFPLRKILLTWRQHVNFQSLPFHNILLAVFQMLPRWISKSWTPMLRASPQPMIVEPRNPLSPPSFIFRWRSKQNLVCFVVHSPFRIVEQTTFHKTQCILCWDVLPSFGTRVPAVLSIAKSVASGVYTASLRSLCR